MRSDFALKSRESALTDRTGNAFTKQSGFRIMLPRAQAPLENKGCLNPYSVKRKTGIITLHCFSTGTLHRRGANRFDRCDLSMQFAAFESLLHESEHSIIWLEGTRTTTLDDERHMQAFARALALRFPRAMFRSDLAPGSHLS